MSISSKLSSKNQIVIPREARKVLMAKSGDQILLVPKGNVVILLNKPRDPVLALKGLGKKIYPGNYIKKERKGW